MVGLPCRLHQLWLDLLALKLESNKRFKCNRLPHDERNLLGVQREMVQTHRRAHLLYDALLLGLACRRVRSLLPHTVPSSLERSGQTLLPRESEDFLQDNTVVRGNLLRP